MGAVSITGTRGGAGPHQQDSLPLVYTWMCTCCGGHDPQAGAAHVEGNLAQFAVDEAQSRGNAAQVGDDAAQVGDTAAQVGDIDVQVACASQLRPMPEVTPSTTNRANDGRDGQKVIGLFIRESLLLPGVSRRIFVPLHAAPTDYPRTLVHSPNPAT